MPSTMARKLEPDSHIVSKYIECRNIENNKQHEEEYLITDYSTTALRVQS